ncbi:MAG: type IV pilus biogenesis protein PilM [bacterium]
MKKGHLNPCGLGVQFGSCSVRLVVLERHRKGVRLQQCCERAFPDGVRFQGVFDPHIKATCIRALQSLLADLRLKTEKATVGLDSRAVFLRRIRIDSWLEEDELQDQVLWEAEQLLVDPLDRCVVDFHVQDVSETVREVLLAVVRRRTVEEYTEVLEKSGLDPFCLDVDLFALSNAYEHITASPGPGPAVLVDVEPGCVRCVVVRERMFCFGRACEMRAPPAELVELLRTAALHVEGGDGSLPFARIVLSGSGALSERLISDLTARCDRPVEVAHPFRGVKMGPSLSRQQLQKEAPAYMIGTGLALRGATEP